MTAFDAVSERPELVESVCPPARDHPLWRRLIDTLEEQGPGRLLCPRKVRRYKRGAHRAITCNSRPRR